MAIPPLVRWVSDKIHESTGESARPKALLWRPFMLATPMVNSGPGVSASPTPKSDRNTAHRHSLVGNRREKPRQPGSLTGRRYGQRWTARQPQCEQTQLRKQKQAQNATQKKPGTASDREQVVPNPNPKGQAPSAMLDTEQRHGNPKNTSHQRQVQQRIQRDQGPPPLKESGAWQHRHSVLNFFESSASVCCI